MMITYVAGIILDKRVRSFIIIQLRFVWYL
jgi:hypothetical protein